LADRYLRRLERGLDRFQRRLPKGAAGALGSVRGPGGAWIRLPAGGLLLVGGVLGFLPVLGFWMIPLGLLLLAFDIPRLRQPVGGAMVRAERWWSVWRRRRARPPGDGNQP
jgi:hypothetical protein